jgi:hypothetical protein
VGLAAGRAQGTDPVADAVAKASALLESRARG